MAIKTKYSITIEIDDKPFSIVVSNKLTSIQQDELDEVTQKHQQSFEKRDSLGAELNEAIEEFEINKHILADADVIEKVKVVFEQKSLNKKIFRLKKEISELEKNITSVSKAMEELFAKRYELGVNGADKVSLKKEIVDAGIGFGVIFSEIADEINKAKEKK